MRVFWIGLLIEQTLSPWIKSLYVKRTFLEHSQKKGGTCKIKEQRGKITKKYVHCRIYDVISL